MADSQARHHDAGRSPPDRARRLLPVSGFTATAKLDVVTEIREHFRQEFGKELREFGSDAFWSRRITDEHRLVCAVDKERVLIAQARYHYQCLKVEEPPGKTRRQG